MGVTGGGMGVACGVIGAATEAGVDMTGRPLLVPFSDNSWVFIDGFLRRLPFAVVAVKAGAEAGVTGVMGVASVAGVCCGVCWRVPGTTSAKTTLLSVK